MTSITLNNLINLFSAYTTNHLALKAYGNGSVKDLESLISTGKKFPLMWTNLENITYPSFNTKLYNFNILIMDILDNTKANEAEIWSDSIQHLEDLIKYIGYNQQDYFKLEQNPTITTFTERFGDYVAGAALKLSIEVDCDLMNSCNIPITPFTFNPVNY